MCKSPNMLADGTLVACRKCWQCRSNRIDYWVGRCIAESKSAVATTSLTLTYGRDADGNESHARTAILTYSDVQKYFKQLRNRGYPCRYLVTGEIGSKNGRAHWHGLVFWQERVPQTMTDYGGNSWHEAKRVQPIEVPIVWDKRFNEPCWPHGFSHWVPVNKGHEKGSIAYACKYINKDVDDPTAQSKFAMSKKPPIGAQYFVNRAQRYVDERISPQDPFYQFPMEAKRKNGEIVTFMLAGKVLEIFCQAFIDKWKEQVGGHYPHSDFLDEYEDRITKREWDRVAEFKPALSVADDRWPMALPPGYTPQEVEICLWAGVPRVAKGDWYLWYYENENGVRAWRNEIAEKTVKQPQKKLRPFKAESGPELTPEYALARLQNRPGVYWLRPRGEAVGTWKKSKTKFAGQTVWMRSAIR